MISDDTKKLAGYAAMLNPIRKENGRLNDFYIAADDWRMLGERIMDHEPWEGLHGLADYHEEQYNGMLDFYRELIPANKDFATIMECGARLIAAAKLIRGDPRGYLRSVEILRETFAFLEGEFGFTWTERQYDWGYVRGNVMIELHALPCKGRDLMEIIRLSEPEVTMRVVDIRYKVDGKLVLFPETMPEITTEAEATAAYGAMADLLRLHCGDILAGVPGALERLVAASEERDRLVGAEMDRLYGPGVPP